MPAWPGQDKGIHQRPPIVGIALNDLFAIGSVPKDVIS